MPRILTVAVFSLLAVATTLSAQQRTGYEGLLSWSSLPRAKHNNHAGLASSWDRSGGNLDFNNYQQPPGHTSGDVDPVTIVSLNGPGLLTRFWMPHATANQAFPLRIFVDGQLAIETDTNTFLGGDFGYFNDPLVSTLIGGQVSYEPILFQESLRIESANFSSPELRSRHYYQWSYILLSEHAIVPPYTGTLTAAQMEARSLVVAMLAAVGDNPAGPSADAIVIDHVDRTIEAGSSFNIAALSGSGCLRRLNIQLSDPSDNSLDGLFLRVRYDGLSANAIDVPISHYFGAGHGRTPYCSLPLGNEPSGRFYSYWPMPYRSGIIVELYNATEVPILLTASELEYEVRPVLPEEGSLHVVHSEATTSTGQAWHSILSVMGSGHYVGSLLYVEDRDVDPTILEGDDLVVVDGQTFIFGTGTEDAYNGGYYYNHAYEQSDDGDVPNPFEGTGPLYGLLRMDFPDIGNDLVRTDQYRWLIADAIPFDKQIEVAIENHGERGGVLFGSVAYYYLLQRSYLFADRFEFGDLSGWDGAHPGN